MTEVGIFSVEANIETNVQPRSDETLLIIRHHVKRGVVDSVYRIGTGEEIIVTLNGLTKVDVTNHKVLIDVSKGHLEHIVVTNAPLPPTTRQPQPQVPPGSIQLVRSIHSKKISITTLAWSPDSREIADSGQSYGDSTTHTVAEIWRVSDGSLLRTHRGLGFYIYNISWSPDGRRIATSDNGCYCVQIWNAHTGQNSAVVNAWANRWVSWSPSSRYLVASGDGEKPSVWNTYSGSQVSIYNGYYAWSEYPAVWSTHGNLIVDNGQIWNGLSNHTIQKYDGLGPPGSGYFEDERWSPDGSRIASTNGSSLVVWDAATGATTWSRGISSDLLSWSPNGRYIAWLSSYAQAGIVDASSGSSVASFQTPTANDIDAVEWSPDGRYIATATNDAIQIWSVPS